MATREELYTALRNADAAGDTEAAQRIASYINGMAPQRQAEPQPAQTTQAPVDEPGWAVQAGRAIMDVPRQVGLTARYGLEGIGQAANIATEPLRQLVVNPLARLVGAPEAAPTSGAATSLADAIGLPSPRNSNERVVGDAARLMASGAGLMGGARAAAQAVGPVASSVLGQLAANPVQQLAGAVGAGLAGGAVREAGGGPGAQAAAGFVGGLAGPLSAGLVEDGVNFVSRRLAASNPQAVDQAVESAARQAGVKWSDLPERVRQSVRQDAANALRTDGELSPAALSRLIDFRRVEGTIPTRGSITLDPVQVTREMNLAKSGANSSDTGLQGLARVQADNNRALIDNLNRAGASDSLDAITTGERLISSLERNLSGQKGQVDALYAQARDSAGRSFPLDNSAFANRVDQLLGDNLVGAALPADVRNAVNRIASNEMPFTVDVAEQLKTRMASLQRSTSDGSARYALGLVRQALDETPVTGLGNQAFNGGARAVNPGNLPAIPGQAGANIGEEAIAAFNQARGANRAMMQNIEASPALKAIYEGTASPDKFVERFIISGSATSKDVQALRAAAAADPDSGAAVRNYLTSYLKEKALNGRSDEIGNFSAAAYNKALRQIGDRKLAAFFDAEQIDQLKAVGRVADYITAQPKGSAVNNSNSGALVLGAGFDVLDRIGAKVPFLGIGPTVQGLTRSVQQGVAQSVAPALLRAPAARPGLLDSLTPATAYGGLLALPGVDRRDDNRR